MGDLGPQAGATAPGAGARALQPGSATPPAPTGDELVALVRGHLDALAPGEDNDRRAEAIVAELGVRELVASVALWERIIRFGDGFHSVARFFVDGSPEQAHILAALRRR